jgi:hypothetical protein
MDNNKKTRLGFLRYFCLAIVIAFFFITTVTSGGGGGDDDDDDSNNMSQDEALYFAREFNDVLDEAVNAANTSATAASSQGIASQQIGSESVQCTETSCTFNVPISYTVNCTSGGSIQVLGDLTGTITNGTGLLQIEVTETISDWKCYGDYTVNGDPYISITGTFSFVNYALSSQHQIYITGAYKWGTGSDETCPIYLTIDIDEDGTGSMTGTMCGYAINEDY